MANISKVLSEVAEFMGRNSTEISEATKKLSKRGTSAAEKQSLVELINDRRKALDEAKVRYDALLKEQQLPVVRQGDKGPTMYISPEGDVTRGLGAKTFPRPKSGAPVTPEVIPPETGLVKSTRSPGQVLEAEFTVQQMLSGQKAKPLLTEAGKVDEDIQNLYKQGQLRLPRGTSIENGVVVDTANKQTRILRGDEAKNRLLNAKVLAGAGVVAAGGVAGATMQETEAPLKKTSTTVEQVEEVKPPADAPSAKDQQVKEIYQRREADKNRTQYNAGVSGARVFRGIAGLGDQALPSQIEESLTRATQLEQGLSEEDKKRYQDLLDATRNQTQDMMDRLETVRKSVLDDQAKQDTYLAVGEALELLGHNITRLFAANYGMRKGVDMSGLRFDRYDWSAAQQRYDKRFESALSKVDAQLQATTKAGREAEAAVVKAQTEAEKRLSISAEKERERATSLLRDYQAQQSAERRTAAQLQQQDIQHQEKMQLERARLDAMKQRNEEVKLAREQGNAQKVVSLENQNFNDALSVIDNTIEEVSEADKTTFSFEQWKELVRRLDDKTMRSGLALKTVLSKDVLEASWWPAGRPDINKEALRARLESMKRPVDMGGTIMIPTGQQGTQPMMSSVTDTDVLPDLTNTPQ